MTYPSHPPACSHQGTRAVSSVASECWGGPGDGTFTIEHVTDFQIEVLVDAEA